MMKLSEIIAEKKQRWKEPEKERKLCGYCGAEMIAEKISYRFWNRGTVEERYDYKYECPNHCLDKEQRKLDNAKRYRQAKKTWNDTGLTRECVGWNLKKMTCENIEYIREYVANFNRFAKALVLLGSKGTGKTLTSECVVKELTHKGFKCRCTNMTEINIEMNKALFNDNYKRFIASLLDYDLLVIDDWGRETYATEKSLENVFQFFNALTKEKKPFIVSINPEMLSIISAKPQLDACLDRFKNSENVKILRYKNGSYRR